MDALQIILIVLAAFIFLFVHNMCLRFAAMLLVREMNVLGKEFRITTMKISAITAATALFLVLVSTSYLTGPILVVLTLIFIKHFLGDGLVTPGWDRALLFWLAWLGCFLLVLGILAVLGMVFVKLFFTKAI